MRGRPVAARELRCLTLVAGQDLQFAVQGNHATAIKSGLAFYTYGKATNPNKPNTETGIQFHAASGNVRVHGVPKAATPAIGARDVSREVSVAS